MKSITLIFLATLAQANVGTKVAEHHFQIANLIAEERIKTGNACSGEVEAYQSLILDHLAQAKQYDDNYPIDTPKMRQVLNDSLGFRRLVGEFQSYRTDAAKLTAALVGVHMYGPSPGVYGNISEIRFGKNGQMLMRNLELLDDAPYVKWNETPGTFRVEVQKQRYSQKILVHVTVNGQDTSYLLRDANGVRAEWSLVPASNPDSNPYFDGFVDFPSECSA